MMIWIDSQHQQREAPTTRSTNPCLCRNTGGLTTHRLRSRSPFGAGRRSGGAFITSVNHHVPIPGRGQAAERIPQCPSAKRRLPQRIISPPCQTPCSRRYPYACHAPRGLGRGAPEGKGYATTSVRSGLGGASLLYLLVKPGGFLGGPSHRPCTGQWADNKLYAPLPPTLNKPVG